LVIYLDITNIENTLKIEEITTYSQGYIKEKEVKDDEGTINQLILGNGIA